MPLLVRWQGQTPKEADKEEQAKACAYDEHHPVKKISEHTGLSHDNDAGSNRKHVAPGTNE